MHVRLVSLVANDEDWNAVVLCGPGGVRLVLFRVNFPRESIRMDEAVHEESGAFPLGRDDGVRVDGHVEAEKAAAGGQPSKSQQRGFPSSMGIRTSAEIFAECQRHFDEGERNRAYERWRRRRPRGEGARDMSRPPSSSEKVSAPSSSRHGEVGGVENTGREEGFEPGGAMLGSLGIRTYADVFAASQRDYEEAERGRVHRRGLWSSGEKEQARNTDEAGRSTREGVGTTMSGIPIAQDALGDSQWEQEYSQLERRNRDRTGGPSNSAGVGCEERAAGLAGSETHALEGVSGYARCAPVEAVGEGASSLWPI